MRDTLSALGLASNPNLYKTAQDLKSLFEARNQIAHELDLRAPQKAGDRARRERRINESKALCHTGLNYAQKVINAIIDDLGPDAGGAPTPSA